MLKSLLMRHVKASGKVKVEKKNPLSVLETLWIGNYCQFTFNFCEDFLHFTEFSDFHFLGTEENLISNSKQELFNSEKSNFPTQMFDRLPTATRLHRHDNSTHKLVHCICRRFHFHRKKNIVLSPLGALPNRRQTHRRHQSAAAENCKNDWNASRTSLRDIGRQQWSGSADFSRPFCLRRDESAALSRKKTFTVLTAQ